MMGNLAGFLDPFGLFAPAEEKAPPKALIIFSAPDFFSPPPLRGKVDWREPENIENPKGVGFIPGPPGPNFPGFPGSIPGNLLVSESIPFWGSE